MAGWSRRQNRDRRTGRMFVLVVIEVAKAIHEDKIEI